MFLFHLIGLVFVPHGEEWFNNQTPNAAFVQYVLEVRGCGGDLGVGRTASNRFIVSVCSLASRVASGTQGVAISRPGCMQGNGAQLQVTCLA